MNLNDDLAHSLRAPVTSIIQGLNLELDHLITLPRFRDAASLKEFLNETVSELMDHESHQLESLVLVSVRRRKPQELKELHPHSDQENQSSLLSPLKTEKPPSEMCGLDGKLNVPYLIQNAEILLNAGENELARRILTKLQNSSPIGSESEVCSLIGRSYQNENRLDEAIQAYKEALVYQGSLKTLILLTQLLIRKKKDAEALIYLQRILTTDSIQLHLRLDALIACGNAASRLEDLVQAENFFRHGLEVTAQRDIRFINNLGALFLKQGRVQEALDTFNEAYELNETHPKTHYALGATYLAAGNLRQAHDHFAESLEIKINQPHLLHQLIKCAYELKSYPVATRILGEYIDEVESTPQLLFSLAAHQLELGRHSDCAMSIAKILMTHPNHQQAIDLRERNRKISNEKKVTI